MFRKKRAYVPIRPKAEQEEVEDGQSVLYMIDVVRISYTRHTRKICSTDTQRKLKHKGKCAAQTFTGRMLAGKPVSYTRHTSLYGVEVNTSIVQIKNQRFLRM